MIVVKEGVHHLLRPKTLVVNGVKIRQKVEGIVMDVKEEGVEAAHAKTEESKGADQQAQNRMFVCMFGQR